MQKRESKEFKEFFERFFIPVCHFIKRYTEEEEVADIAQEVFVKVYEKWNEFDSLGNAKAFLYIAARNLCLDFIKHKKAWRRSGRSCIPKRSYPARDFPYPAYGDRQAACSE